MRVLISFVSAFIILLTWSCDLNQKKGLQKPDIHFTQEKMCLRAPNELLFYNSKYHLFYQCQYGHTSQWGHATSTDLVHWQELPPALKSDPKQSLGPSSIIIDWNNTIKFGDNNSPMLAFYICTNGEKVKRGQDSTVISIAFSNDQGVTWQKIKDPIILSEIPHPIRNVKIIWHEETQRWIMLVLTKYDIRFYASVDLINWNYEDIFDGGEYLKQAAWEYLAFFPAKIEGSNKWKWVLMISGDAGSPNGGSGTLYFVGYFDGYTYTRSGDKPQWLDNGSDNYAGVVLSNYMDFEKSLYYMGWINNRCYKQYSDRTKCIESYTLPREMSLVEKYGNYYLRSKPIEIRRKKKNLISETKLTGYLALKRKLKSPLEINLLFDTSNKLHFDFAKVYGIEFSNNDGDKMTIGYNNQQHIFFISEQKNTSGKNEINYSRYIIDQSTMDFKIIIDNTSTELFAINGMISLTQKSFITRHWDKISLFAEAGNIILKKGSICELENTR